MNIIEELHSLNYMGVAIAIATVTSYLLGFAWYHWTLFGKAWANALGITKEQADNTEGLGGAFAISLFSGLTKTISIALLMSVTNMSGILNGVFLGVIIAVVFTATSLGYYNGFARSPSKLTLINSAHSVVELALIGAIIGIFT